MEDRTQLSSPSGDGDVRTPDSEDRITARRPKQSLPGWPDWTLASQVTPWEAVEIPDGPSHEAGAAESGPETTRCGAVSTSLQILLWGRGRGSWEGGGPKMRRLLAALTTLATLFVVAGAGWKY